MVEINYAPTPAFAVAARGPVDVLGAKLVMALLAFSHSLAALSAAGTAFTAARETKIPTAPRHVVFANRAFSHAVYVGGWYKGMQLSRWNAAN